MHCDKITHFVNIPKPTLRQRWNEDLEEEKDKTFSQSLIIDTHPETGNISLCFFGRDIRPAGIDGCTPSEFDKFIISYDFQAPPHPDPSELIITHRILLNHYPSHSHSLKYASEDQSYRFTGNLSEFYDYMFKLLV